MEERPAFDKALAALQHRDFRFLFLSSVVSGVGRQLLDVSNYWQVYALADRSEVSWRRASFLPLGDFRYKGLVIAGAFIIYGRLPRGPRPGALVPPRALRGGGSRHD